MTISNTLAEQIQQDIEQAQTVQLQADVAAILPRALLQVVATLVEGTTQDEAGNCTTILSHEGFGKSLSLLSQAINLLGYDVSFQDEEDGSRLISLVPITPVDTEESDGQAPGNSYE